MVSDGVAFMPQRFCWYFWLAVVLCSVSSWGTQGDASGQFQFPEGIAVSSSGMVYVADTGNHRLQLFSLTGSFVAIFGEPGSAFG